MAKTPFIQQLEEINDELLIRERIAKGDVYNAEHRNIAQEWLRRKEEERASLSAAKRDAREERTLAIAESSKTISEEALSIAKEANRIASADLDAARSSASSAEAQASAAREQALWAKWAAIIAVVAAIISIKDTIISSILASF